MKNLLYIHNTQYPVGQGGLHLGEIYVNNYDLFFNTSNELYAYIYDCGAISNLDNLKKQIDDLIENLILAKNNIVELNVKLRKLYIFISHLHQDHVNGLPYLRDKLIGNDIILPKDKIEIYFPFTSDIEKNIILCSFKDNDNIHFDDFKQIVINPSSFLGDNFQVIFIDDNQRDNHIKDFQNNTILKNHFENISFEKYDKWILRMFYKKFEDKNILPLVKEIKNFDYHLLTKDTVKNIQSRYKEYFNGKELNLSSLCLYFGSESQKGKYNYFHTGDINLKNPNVQDELKEHYKDYINNFRTVQIPHHGSKNNSNLETLKLLFPNYKKLFVTKQEKPNGYQQPTYSQEYVNLREEIMEITENNDTYNNSCIYEVENINFYS